MGLHVPTPDCFEDCRTKEEAKRYFQRFGHERRSSNITPATDALLALRKLRPSNPFLRRAPELHLRPDQAGALRQVAAEAPPSWDAYCDALSIEQIKCVGW